MPKHASVTNKPCTCDLLQRVANDPFYPIVFDTDTNEYHFTWNDGALLVIGHCPFCGGAAPESKRALLFAQIPGPEESRLAKLLKGVTSMDDAINRFGNHKKANKRGGPVVAPALRAFALVSESMGLMRMTSAEFHADVKAKRLGAMGIEATDIDTLIEERSQARSDKNWERADEIRNELEAKSILVMDLADGVQWRVRLSSPESS
jgi:hypothetical protein